MLEKWIAAVHRFDSVEKLREGILACVLDGKDSFELSDYGIDNHASARDFYHGLRRGLHELADADIIPAQEKDVIRRDLTERLDQFEQAALSLIFDRSMFFMKTKYGNPGTNSELVGTMLVSMMREEGYPSPDRQSGNLAGSIMPHIEYDAILSGYVRLKDEQRFVHNRSLLELLLSARTDTLPTADYWRNLQRNGDFIPFCYDALKAMNLPEARHLIPKMVATYLGVANVTQLRRDFFLMSTLHQEFGNPISDFLNNPANHFQQVFSSDLDKTSIKKAPSTIAFLEGGQIVILSNYATVNGVAEVGIVYINDKINEYRFRIDTGKHKMPTEIPETARRRAIRIIREYQKFTEQYRKDLARALT